ncbi:MAG: carbonic anhydrase [Verrucomicrobiota bacterium]|jgi:carbonic anhydrase
MRLFEAIIDANHRAVAGDAKAGLHPAEFADELPVIALTCVDPRLNVLFPNALALPAEQFIWLRNAGNSITGQLSSTMRSLALACAVKGGREIAIIGHTDCQVAKTSGMQLLSRFQALGIDRSRLPDNLAEFFGTFGSERQNVIKGCDFARNSPLIGPKIPVHGLMIDTETGKLDWVVNGYNALQMQLPPMMDRTHLAQLGAPGTFKDFEMGEMKFPETKIGDSASTASPANLASSRILNTTSSPVPDKTSPAPPLIKPAKVPMPPPIRPRPYR